MTEGQASKLVAALMAAYSTSKLTTESSPVYERMLSDLDYQTADAAVARLIATSKYPPTVAEIREAALTLHHGEVRAGGEAWRDVGEAIGRYGRLRVPGRDFTFIDPVVGECVDGLGWRELCESENATADRARFVELYDKLAARHRRSRLSEVLPAMQKFRALQAAAGPAPRQSIASGEAQPIGRVLKLVFGGDGAA
jgi:hypothetical protein